MNIFLASILVFITIFCVPIAVYGLFVKFWGLKEPEKKVTFFVGVLIQKIATVMGFVALFMMAQSALDDVWLVYGLVWFGMFALTEVGQVYMAGSSRTEAVAGIVSEMVYFPVSAYMLHLLV